ncbi:MAG: thiamine-phosphate pyrophosphorylase [candidate division WOR-3 bacterium]|nr:thiamine-phosphate pyrophosphorylase [candidate division WOR-3 bacterium]
MPKRAIDLSPAVGRIVDANLNRLSEGLKVIEDITRLTINEPALLNRIRQLRTRFGKEFTRLRRAVVQFRNSKQDPGRSDRFDRLKRQSLNDVLFANFKRTQEAARVLEEVLKIDLPGYARRIKKVRFTLYDLEKATLRAANKINLDLP